MACPGGFFGEGWQKRWGRFSYALRGLRMFQAVGRIDKPGQVWFDVRMKTYTITESKTRLSALVQQVMETGETVVIGRNGRPMVQLSPYKAPASGKRLGAFEGRIHVSEDFDAWEPEEAEALGLE